MIQYSDDICYNLKLYYNHLKKTATVKCPSKVSGDKSNKITSGHKSMNTWQETEYLMIPILNGVKTIPICFACEFRLTHKSKQPLE